MSRLIDTVIFDNFKVSVQFEIAKAQPSVGLTSRYVEDFSILSVDNCGDTQVIDFFMNKLINDERELEIFFDTLLEN